MGGDAQTPGKVDAAATNRLLTGAIVGGLCCCCWAFALAAFLRRKRKRRGGKAPPLSIEELSERLSDSFRAEEKARHVDEKPAASRTPRTRASAQHTAGPGARPRAGSCSAAARSFLEGRMGCAPPAGSGKSSTKSKKTVDFAKPSCALVNVRPTELTETSQKRRSSKPSPR